MKFKKRIMTVLWRVQQAQMVISIVFWSLTLTGVFYPYVRERWLNSWLGPEHVLVGMSVMFITVITLIVLFGLAYDRLKFWREQQMVIQERNPFTYGSRMAPAPIILWWAVLNPENEEAREEALDLIAHNLKDPDVWAAYQEIRREVRQ
jgi:hypothetical protein